MMSRFPRAAAVLTIGLAAVLLSACAPSDAQTQPTPSSIETAAGGQDAGAQATPTPTAAGAAAIEPPTCETMVSAQVVSDFTSIGWTYQAEDFYIGATPIEDGILCRWADFTGPASDHLQMFGWAAIDDADAKKSQDALVAEGWKREESSSGVYITESPETAIATDSDGYGMTYLFTDGAVTVADTKQGLLLIEWPKA